MKPSGRENHCRVGLPRWCLEIEFDAGQPRRAAPTVRFVGSYFSKRRRGGRGDAIR